MYEVPVILVEGDLEIQAGSPLGPDFPNAFEDLEF